MIDNATGWFEIFKVPESELDKVMVRKNEYIDKSSDRIGQLINNTWIYI